ncbi:MAG: hypothetical protein A2682_00100 [Candidatus Terrybacteria bacterium RIFCSPHIGHO2_01_FULL_58_15]|uniref:DUF1573 domain-containing protein n=1 Tax=Terrybacteria sp. (strain RIFCSPHIGHO2_01_FULL_58_15) TaxID=1802363 RepID=A0A1G2PMZ3_TERXR|nr:MAG: hypothetical protein A2682_00100 [Candidatus Terrybacteria bacterium RIFCSPHIGHO2_01_FULL_58_15]
MVISVALLVGAGFALFAFGAARPDTSAGDTPASGQPVVAVEPLKIDLGTVAMSSGVAERTFAVKNTGDGSLRVTGLQTSCMCTSAQLEVGSEKSAVFGMAGGGGGHGGSGAAPRSWAMEVPAGGEGTLHVFYDPNAHGPAGVGPFERVVLFNTDDPAQERVEVSIRGVVVP